MKNCRVCCAPLGPAVYESPAPGITSTATIADLPTAIFICEGCEHGQSPNLPDLQQFYDTQYRISLGTEDHDQLYAMENGKAIYRTDKQAQVALHMLQIPAGASLLDYGAAKAATLRKIKRARPDIHGFVFDVSDSYRGAWEGWLDNANTATHKIPEEWHGRFDAVTAHFVIEHVADPRDTIATMASLLKPGGRLLVSVPDPIANPGDLIVVDHINHFSARSLHRLLSEAGLRVERIEKNVLNAALFSIATKIDGEGIPTVEQGASFLFRRLCANWWQARQHVSEKATSFHGRKSAIYGAGFYGAWLYSIIRDRITPSCFLDNNAHLQGTDHFGVPVLAPGSLPSHTEVLFVGLNPQHAKDILSGIEMPRKKSLELVFIPAAWGHSAEFL